MSTPADTSALERRIDQQVCALDGLTPEEIALVEGGQSESLSSLRYGYHSGGHRHMPLIYTEHARQRATMNLDRNIKSLL